MNRIGGGGQTAGTHPQCLCTRAADHAAEVEAMRQVREVPDEVIDRLIADLEHDLRERRLIPAEV
jgi:hypothetical protein